MYTRSQSSPGFAYRIDWYIGMRWIFLGVIIAPVVLSSYISEGWSSGVQVITLLGLAAIAGNGVFYFLSKKLTSASGLRILAIALIVLDIIFISFLIYMRGGVESRAPILYTIPILMSAAILGRRSIYASALLSLVAYNGIVIGDYLGIIETFGADNPNLQSRLSYVLNSLIFFNSIFIVVGMSVDFITRLLIEKEKQATESLNSLRHAQAVAKLGSWEWNLKTNEATWSQELYTQLGIDDKTTPITPELYLERIHPDDKKFVATIIRRAIKKRSQLSCDYRIIAHDGEVRYVHSDGEVLTDKHGDAVKIVGTIRDVTEEKLLDGAKNEFVALASHQLRTPATAVKQYLSMLIDGYAGELTSKQKHYVEIANTSNERQITTINDLLNVAQIDSGKMKLRSEVIDLVGLLKIVVIEAAIHIADKHQTIDLKTRHETFYVKADSHRLRMALESIIENAHKYSPEHKRIEVRLTRANRKACIAIKDYGIGIDKSDMPKLFRKFSRIDNPANPLVDGAGLGLYWVKKVVQLHRGTISVASKPHRGTTFKITLPQARRSRVKVASSTTPQ